MDVRTYVACVHPGDPDKVEYLFKAPGGIWNPGETVLVDTIRGEQLAVITAVFRVTDKAIKKAIRSHYHAYGEMRWVVGAVIRYGHEESDFTPTRTETLTVEARDG